jgi:hypothetical protein
MFRLGLRLSLRSGKEALTRFILTTVAVGVGTAVLFAVFAEFNAFHAASSRQCWECTAQQQNLAFPQSQRGPAARSVLWNYSADYFRGQTIERLDLAALGPNAPVPPGIPRLPRAGQYYASPALAALVRSVPRDQLGDRFPGSLAGTIGEAALSGPGELVVFAGYAPHQLAAMPGTVRVTTIYTAIGRQVWTPYFRYAFAVGVLAVLFPILILIGTATRLAAARREERYAAMRLVGATPRQIGVISSVDAIVGGLAGTVLGKGIFLLIRPPLASAALIGTRYFAATVTPTAGVYLGMLVAVPVVSAIAALLALRRVRISPLGVSRRAAPPPPTIWRLVPLLLGIVLFVVGMLATGPKSIGAPAYPGLLVIMIGLVIGGPWLTERAARLFARLTGGASPLLAARRLADNPKAAFRTVRGLVLAVFLGTVVAGLLPAVNSISATRNATALNNVLLDAFNGGPGAGLAPRRGAALVSGLRGVRGATVFPLYAPSGASGANSAKGASPFGIIGCASLRQLAVLGECAPGVSAVLANDGNLLFSDNPVYSTQAIAGRDSQAFAGRLAGLPLQAVLVRANGPATLERVRTFLDTHTPSSGTVPPRTFGETVQIRLGYANILERLVYLAVALTLLVAGCSLAVVAGGGLVERKRPFTLMRVSGTPLATLYRVVLTEALLPLIAATLAAAGIAYGISVLTVKKMAPAGTPTPVLGHVYYLTMGAGLVASVLVILVTLPLLGRITGPGTVRFE